MATLPLSRVFRFRKAATLLAAGFRPASILMVDDHVSMDFERTPALENAFRAYDNGALSVSEPEYARALAALHALKHGLVELSPDALVAAARATAPAVPAVAVPTEKGGLSWDHQQSE